MFTIQWQQVVASRVLEVKDFITRQSLLDFQNVEHRLEHVINVHYESNL